MLQTAEYLLVPARSCPDSNAQNSQFWRCLQPASVSRWSKGAA
jgi:hypothetical protein